MHEDAHPRRLSFLFLSVLATACLVLLCIDLAKTNVQSLKNGNPITPVGYLQTLGKSAQLAARKFEYTTHATKGTAKRGPATVAAGFTGAIAHGIGALGSFTAHGVATAGRGVGSIVLGFAHIIGRIPHFVALAVNVNTYIKTADYVHVPVIGPPADPSVPGAIAVTPALAVKASPVAQPVPAPAPATPTVAAAPPAIATPPIRFNTLNTYAHGNCTWWAANRRAEVGDPIPNSWGNAATWASRAARDGYTVDHHPSPGAIMQTPYSAGGLGHVAYVEGVDTDGTWHISEMNAIGFNEVDRKAECPSAAANYNFIHDRQ